MLHRLLLTAFCLGLSAAPTYAADPNTGRVIAERWCASCHLVTPDQKRANADAPSFASIGARYKTDQDLARFLESPYPRMPSMSLSHPEISDLVSYIRSLAPAPGAPQIDKDEKLPEAHRG